MAKDYELYRAIDAAKRDAERELQEYRKRLSEKPLYGWSQEKHSLYFEEKIRQALTTIDFLFVRLMQINPD